MQKERKTITAFLTLWFQYYNRTFILPEKLVNILLIQASLINLSYIYQNNQQSWIYILALFARPQLVLHTPYFEYFCVVYLILWPFYLFKQNAFGSAFVKLLNTLLKISVFNFTLEQLNDILGIVVSALICMIQLFESIVMQGTLNINTINFQTPYSTKLNTISLILNIILIYFNKFNYNQRAVQFVAILSSFIQLIAIFQYNSFRNEQIRICVFFCQISTFYLGIVAILNCYEHSFTLILLPLLWKLVNILKFTNQTQSDSIIEASRLLKEGKLFHSFLALNTLKQEGIERDIKRSFLMETCIDEINKKINSQAHHQYNLQGVSQNLIENDEKNVIFSDKINDLIEQKLRLLYSFKDLNFKQINNYVQNVQEIKKQLDKHYKTHNSSMVQSLIVFFYSEIINDFIAAKSLQHLVNTTLENEIKINDSALSSLIYLVANYQNNELITRKISSNAPKTFCNKLFDELIPIGVREWHSLLVDQFVLDGKSKFVRNLNSNYVVNGNYIENVEFAIDIVYTTSVDFICLFQPTQLQTKSIIVNQQFEIASISQDFKDFSNLSKYFCVGERIDKFIPEIIYITTSCYMENLIVIPSHQIASVVNFADCKSEMNYYCDIQVIVKNHNKKMIYMIIQFDNFKRQMTKKHEANEYLSSPQVSEKNTHENIPFEIENEKITEPYQFSQITTERKQFERKIFSPRDDEGISLLQFNRNSKRAISQFQRTLFKEVFVEQINEVQSQVSSLKQFRNSKFYRKYELYNQFLEHIPQKGLHRMIVGLILLLFLYQLLFILIQMTNISLLQFSDDINLLEIKNLIFQPMEVFLVTRWTLFNYKNLLLAGQMTQEDYNIKSVFAKSNLNLGYDQLNINIQSVLFKSQLQPLLQQKYIYAYQYLDTYTNERYNISLRTAIEILLNFQYILKMNYVFDGTVNTDSSQVFYSYKNYMLLNDIATQLNNDISEQTLIRGKQMENTILIIFVIQQSLLIFNIIIIFLGQQFINRRLMMRINLYSFIEEKEVQTEIEKQQELLRLLKNDNSRKFSYRLDVELKEQQFKAKNNDVIIAKQKMNVAKGVTFVAFLFFLLFLYFFFTIYQSIIFVSQNNYLVKYPDTTNYIKGFANLGVDIPQMFAQREILYGRIKLMYLNQSDFDYDLLQINQSLQNTINFTSMDIDFSKLLVTETFQSYYEDIQSNDLCNFIPDDLKQKSEFLCLTIFNSNMKLGLKAILIYIQNLITTEMEINNFTMRNASTQYELEGIFILSQIIKEMNTGLFIDLINQTIIVVANMKVIMNLNQIVNICCLVLIFILIIFGIPHLNENLLNNTLSIVRFAYIIPIQTLFNNDMFERVVRSLIMQN